MPLKSGDFIYVVVGPVTNPTDTEPTSSFTYLITDNLGSPVETVDSGISFTAAAGGFSVIEMDMDIKTINEPGVSYTFTLQPQDDFDSTAKVKLSLPSEVSVSDAVELTSVSDGLNARATITS